MIADAASDRWRCCSARSPPAAGSDPKTKRTLLVAIQVAGVPEIAVEEALWLAAGVLHEAELDRGLRLRAADRNGQKELRAEHTRRDPAARRRPARPCLRGRPDPRAGERRARDDLRRQIARLERQLGELFASAFPRHGLEWGDRRRRRAAGALAPASSSGFATRSPLRLRDAQAELARRADVEEANRGLLERMIAEPDRHRWVMRLQRGHRRAAAAATGIRARAGASSGCCSAGGGSGSRPVAR